jgi:hypothetical protein
MSKALVPTEQKQVLFYDDEVTAVQMDDGSVYVPVRPLCDYLGVAWNAQYERIMRDTVLSEVRMFVRITRTDIKARSRQPKSSDMICLP